MMPPRRNLKIRQITPHPTIRVTSFKCKKIGQKEPPEASGIFEWNPVDAPPVKAHFHIRRGELMGYVYLRYVWKMQFIRSIIVLVGCMDHFGHVQWVFKCPKCRRGRHALVFKDGPYWTCRVCAKISKLYSIQRTHYDRMDIKDIKRNLSARSVTKKTKALQAVISLREDLLRRRQRLL
jgi:hypothetical protein